MLWDPGWDQRMGVGEALLQGPCGPALRGSKRMGLRLGPGDRPDSRILAWALPWTEEPGGGLSTGSHRVGHD